jgi:mRNA-degrading endonuclease RelE of RelBE toxin-antitoxin system
MRELIATRQFEKDFSRIPTKIIAHADVAVSKLRKDPFDISLDTKKLSYISPAVYRVRIRQYRLIYSFTKTSLTLHRFRHRKDIYRNL